MNEHFLNKLFASTVTFLGSLILAVLSILLPLMVLDGLFGGNGGQSHMFPEGAYRPTSYVYMIFSFGTGLCLLLIGMSNKRLRTSFSIVAIYNLVSLLLLVAALLVSKSRDNGSDVIMLLLLWINLLISGLGIITAGFYYVFKQFQYRTYTSMPPEVQAKRSKRKKNIGLIIALTPIITLTINALITYVIGIITLFEPALYGGLYLDNFLTQAMNWLTGIALIILFPALIVGSVIFLLGLSKNEASTP